MITDTLRLAYHLLLLARGVHRGCCSQLILQALSLTWLRVDDRKSLVRATLLQARAQLLLLGAWKWRLLTELIRRRDSWRLGTCWWVISLELLFKSCQFVILHSIYICHIGIFRFIILFKMIHRHILQILSGHPVELLLMSLVVHQLMFTHYPILLRSRSSTWGWYIQAHPLLSIYIHSRIWDSTTPMILRLLIFVHHHLLLHLLLLK